MKKDNKLKNQYNQQLQLKASKILDSHLKISLIRQIINQKNREILLYLNTIYKKIQENQKFRSQLIYIPIDIHQRQYKYQIFTYIFFLSLLIKINAEEISATEVKAEIKQFIAVQESEESKAQNKKIETILEQNDIKQLVQFDRKKFDIQVEELLSQIDYLKNSFCYLNVNFGQEFVLEKSSKFPLEQINEIEVGTKYKLSGKAVLLSNKNLCEGEYTVEIKISSITKGDCIVIGLVKVNEISSTNFWSDTCSALCISCPNFDGQNFSKVQGNYFGELIGKQVLNIKAKINIKKDIFYLSDDKDQNIFKTNYSLKKDIWKFYIYKYKDGPDSFDFQLGEVRFRGQV